MPIFCDFLGFLVLGLLLGRGYCVIKDSEPEVGSTIELFVGDETELFCEVTSPTNQPRVTLWSLMLDGQTDVISIQLGDPLFNITGPPLPDGSGLFNTNLTIVSATLDLDNAVIYCGSAVDLLAGNFTIRVSGQICSRHVNVTNGVLFVEPGMNVCFQCQTTEPVMWRLNGEDIDPSDGIVMDEVLLTFDIEAQFPPGVLNQLSCSSSVTSFVVITLFVPPVVIGATTVNETDTLTLSCDSSGSSPPPSISWLAPDGSDIMSEGGSITIDDIQRSQSGNYTCVLTRSSDTRSTSVVVTVQYIPEVSTTQTDQVLVSLGDNLLLSCDYNAVPTPDVTWLFDGQELQAASSATRSDLLLTAVAVEDGGVYTCTAMNLLGQNSVAITVAVTPVIVVDSIPETGSTIAGFENETNILVQCKIFDGGQQRVTVWSILKENAENGVPDLINNNDPDYSITGDPVPGEPPLTFRNNLTILSLTADFDRAVLFCGSSVDRDAANFTLRIDPVDCGDLDDPDFGDVDFSDTTFGSKATYSCDDGFSLVGDEERVCEASGEWSGDAPVCELTDTELQFIADTPQMILSGDTTAHGDISVVFSQPSNGVSSLYTCTVQPRTPVGPLVGYPCDTGSFTATQLDPGRYIIQVRLEDDSGDVSVIRNRIRVPTDPNACQPYLINNGVTVISASSASVQWSSTGSPTGFWCKLDGNPQFECSGPAIDLENLGPGRHTFRIRSRCSRVLRRAISTRFTV